MDSSGEKQMENSVIPIFILDPLSFVMCLCRLSVFSLEFAIVEHWVCAIFPANCAPADSACAMFPEHCVLRFCGAGYGWGGG